MNLEIGLSALQASQFAINNVSHNLANATTEGYHRQDVIFRTRFSDYQIEGQYVGTGVDISELRRMRSLITESALTTSVSDLARIEQSILVETRIEALVTPGEGSLQSALEGLFNNFSRLSANPDETSLRNSIVNQAGSLAARIRETTGQLVNIQNDVQQQIEIEVEALNREIAELVDLQYRIRTDPDGRVPNDLWDQRDQLVNKIAERVDVQRYEFVQDQLGLGIAGGSVSIGLAPIEFETALNDQGQIQIQLANGERAIHFSGGRLASLVQVNNELVPEYSQKVDDFAGQLINQFDQIHAQGLGLDGPFSALQAARAVSDVDVPLAESAVFPMEAGELFVTVTDPGGDLRTSSIAIDPAVDSLRDVATRLSGIADIQALVDSATGLMSVVARPGFHFDFTGRLETSPDTALISGTTAPRISGNYIGTDNETYTLTATGSGEIGKTPGLKFQVADSNGSIIQEIDVGDGYEAGSEIDIGDGVQVSFSVGDVVAGDQFDVVRVANADTTGLLSAVGMNHFFTGTDAKTIDLSSRFAKNPSAIATSKSGELADTRNLEDFIALRESTLLGGGRLTFESYLADVNTEIGFRVQTSERVQASLSQLKFQYETERDAVSGVDVNEELIELSQHQKSYEAAVQVVRTMESMLDELFQIIR